MSSPNGSPPSLRKELVYLAAFLLGLIRAIPDALRGLLKGRS